MSDQCPLDIQEILRILPHRYPFVLVDRVIEYSTDKSIRALKNVTINEPFFQGHFPVEPVMPGVLVVEGMAQVGALLAFLSEPEKVGEKLVYFGGIDKARFRRKVVPGDQIIFEISVLKHKSRVFKLEGKALVDDQLVAQAELLASFS
ncbi:MAG: 3-hydroxyacyl-ACP dehydratase FabZ [Thermodesulfobacteriota bacterium]